MKRWFCLALIVAVMLSVAASAGTYGASYYSGEMYIINCNSYVNLRRYASTSAPSLGRIYRGTEVWVEPYSDTFAHVYFGGDWGYVLTDYLGKDNYDESYSVNDYMYVTNCDSWVSLREYANTSSRRLMKVPKGAAVYVYRQEGTFYVCEYRGVQGWIPTKYLR